MLWNMRWWTRLIVKLGLTVMMMDKRKLRLVGLAMSMSKVVKREKDEVAMYNEWVEIFE